MEMAQVSSQNKRSRNISEPAEEEEKLECDSLAKKPRELQESVESRGDPSGSQDTPQPGSCERVNHLNNVQTVQGEGKPESGDNVVVGKGTVVSLTAGKATAEGDAAAVVSAGGDTAVGVTADEESAVERDGSTPTHDDSNIGNESDSDLDYDDLDDLVVPSDADDFVDDDDGVDSGAEDDQSVASSTTTVSISSVGSNTPSLVGESLESVSLGESGKRKHNWVSLAPNLTDSPALRRSLFSNIPPTINFMLHNEISAHSLPESIRRLLKWKLSNITPAIVKRCSGNSGFRLMRKTCTDWSATWGKHMKSIQFKDIKESQKINHFPGTFNIGRKDRLWKNYHRLMMKFGKSEFGFLPRTFILPTDTKLLKKIWERRGGRGRWIVKPPALARGIGITVVNKWSQIPKTRPLVVQRYVARPYLINGTKFDLRLYVLVTSVNPLRIYLYDDGLVRFASNKYSNDSKKVSDVFVHLTNYSINKNSATYTHNEESSVAQGHKWTLKSLWRHFDAEGIDHTVIWEKIKDLMIKTVISAENSMSTLFQQNVSSRYSCFELFGFDILLDSKLKPWLIEVNISPSLHNSSTLDLDVKSPLATEVFNMARYHIPNKMRISQQKELAEEMGYSKLLSLCHEKRLYVKDISKAERAKHDSIVNSVQEMKTFLPPLQILDNLTPDDTRHLVISEDELATSRRFQRIFPTKDSHSYFKYLEKPRYYNILLSAWEQRYSGMNREAGRTILENLCLQKHHLKVPANVYVKKTPLGQQTIDISGLAAPTSAGQSSQETDTTMEPASCHASSLERKEQTPLAPGQVESPPPPPPAQLSESQYHLSGSSTEMDWGYSVTPSPRGTPEHPATASGTPEHPTATPSPVTLSLDQKSPNSNYLNSTTTITDSTAATIAGDNVGNHNPAATTPASTAQTQFIVPNSNLTSGAGDNNSWGQLDNQQLSQHDNSSTVHQ